MKQFLLGILCIGLMACGSESEKDRKIDNDVAKKDSEVDDVEPEKGREIYGAWVSQGEDYKTYYFFSKDQFLVFASSGAFDCYMQEGAAVEYSDSANSFTVSFFGNVSTIDYEIVDDALKLADSELVMVRTPLVSSDMNSCRDESLLGSIDIELEFASLPSDADLVGYSSIEVDVFFDLDNNDQWSDGDIFTELFGFKDLMDPQDDTVLSINSMQSGGWYRYQESSQDDNYSYSSARLSSTDYQVNGSTISYSLPRSAHKAYANITGDEPIRVEATLASCRDSIPNTEGYVQGGMLEYSDSAGDVLDYDNQSCGSDKPKLDLVRANVTVTTQ